MRWKNGLKCPISVATLLPHLRFLKSGNKTRLKSLVYWRLRSTNFIFMIKHCSTIFFGLKNRKDKNWKSPITMVIAANGERAEFQTGKKIVSIAFFTWSFKFVIPLSSFLNNSARLYLHKKTTSVSEGDHILFLEQIWMGAGINQYQFQF